MNRAAGAPSHCNPVAINHPSSGRYLTVDPDGPAGSAAVMAAATPLWRAPILQAFPKHLFCAYSTASTHMLGPAVSAAGSGSFMLRARHTGMFCRMAALPQFGGVLGMACDQRSTSGAGAFSLNGTALLHQGSVLQVPAAAGLPLVDAAATIVPASRQDLAISPAAASDAPWAQCTPVTISHATLGTLTAGTTPAASITPGAAYPLLPSTTAPSDPTRQLFCLYEVGNEASTASIAEGKLYLFRSVYHSTFLSIADGKLVAYASTGYMAAGPNPRAAVGLIYSGGRLVDPFTNQAVVLEGTGQPVLEGGGALPASAPADQTLMIRLVSGAPVAMVGGLGPVGEVAVCTNTRPLQHLRRKSMLYEQTCPMWEGSGDNWSILLPRMQAGPRPLRWH